MYSALHVGLKGCYFIYIVILVMAVCVISIWKLDPKCTEVM